MRTNRLFTLISAAVLALGANAQAPQGFSYQAVARDAFGNAAADQSVGVQFVLHQGNALGAVVYAETHSATTNSNGLFALTVGGGSAGTGTFSGIDWSVGPYFLEVGMDIGSTGSYTSLGTQQLMSVPYALYAGKSNVPDGTEIGQILHWTGSTWAADSGLYVAGKRFGIGVTTPEAPLHILADTPSGSAITLYSANAATGPGVFNPAAWSLQFNPTGENDPGFSIDDLSSGTGLSRLFISGTTGNVGIGTTHPEAPLSIEPRDHLYQKFETGDIPNQEDFAISSGGDTGLSFDQDTPDGGTASRLFIQSTTGHIGIGTLDPPAPLSVVSRNVLKSYFQRGDTPSSSDFGITTDSSGFGIAQGTPDNLASRMFIQDSTGHVGIGTQDPPAPLSIETRQTLKTYFETGDVPTADQFGFTSDGTGFGIGQGAPDNLQSRLFIQSSTGNVGIGTEIPEAPLAVVSPTVLKTFFQTGDFPTQSDFALTSGATGFGIEQGTPSDLVSRLFIQESDGFIGLGTIAPTAKLHVQGASDGGMVGLKVRNTASTHNEGWKVGHIQVAALATRDGAFVVVEDGVAPTERITILPGGKVGINETIPDTKLHVSRDLAEPDAALDLIEGTGIVTIGPITDNIVADYRGIQARHGEYVGDVLSMTASDLQLQPLGGRLLVHEATHVLGRSAVITEDAWLGLGTLTPGERIEIDGAIKIGTSMGSNEGTIRYTGTDFEGRKGGTWVSLTSSGFTDGFVQSAAPGAIHYSPAGGGNVGINEPIPDTKLHVSRPLADPAAALDLIEGTGIMTLGPMTDNIVADYRGIQARHGVYVAGGSTLSMTVSDLNLQRLGGDILIHGESTIAMSDRAMITSDARLGLGTITPAERIEVDGAIKIGTSLGTSDGTIRYTGSEFQGRTGGSWRSLGSEWGKVDNTDAIYYSPAAAHPKVGIGTDSPTATLHVESEDPPAGSNVAAFVSLIDSQVNIVEDRDLIGLRVVTQGSSPGAGNSKNIGLYVSEVSGQADASSNIAAVLNGNVVIGDLSGGSGGGAGGSRIFTITNTGGSPTTVPGITDRGIQMYSADLGGVSTLHVMGGDGDVIKLYRETPLSLSDASALSGTYDASTEAVINNLRTRLNELEARLQNIGVLE
ncbi:MAG: hypothetical protein ABI432_13710 [Flavobacteriales bacterium]